MAIQDGLVIDNHNRVVTAGSNQDEARALVRLKNEAPLSGKTEGKTFKDFECHSLRIPGEEYELHPEVDGLPHVRHVIHAVAIRQVAGHGQHCDDHANNDAEVHHVG